MSKTKNLLLTLVTFILALTCFFSVNFVKTYAEPAIITNSDFVSVTGNETGKITENDINSTDVVIPYTAGNALYYGDMQKAYLVDMASFDWAITINALAVGQSFTVSFIKDTTKMPFDGAVGVSYVFHRVESAINIYILDAADGSLIEEMKSKQSMWAYYEDGEFEEYPKVEGQQNYCGGMIGRFPGNDFTGSKLKVTNMQDAASFSGTTFRPSIGSMALGRTVYGSIFENRDIKMSELVLVLSAGGFGTFDGAPTDDLSFTLATPNDKKTKAYKSETTRLQLITKLSSYVTKSESAVNGELSGEEYAEMLAFVEDIDLSVLRTREKYVQEENLQTISANIALVNQEVEKIPNVVNEYDTALKALANLDEVTQLKVETAENAKELFDKQSLYIAYLQGEQATQIGAIVDALDQSLLTRAELHLQIKNYEDKVLEIATATDKAEAIVLAQRASTEIEKDKLSMLSDGDKQAFETRISECDKTVKNATIGNNFNVENYKINIYKTAVDALTNASSVSDIENAFAERPTLSLTGIMPADQETLKNALANVDQTLGSKITAVMKGWVSIYEEKVYELNSLTALSQDKIDAALSAAYDKESYQILCEIASTISYDISVQTAALEECDRAVSAAPVRLLLTQFNTIASGEISDVSALDTAYKAWVAVSDSDVSILSASEKTAYDSILESAVALYEQQAIAIISVAVEAFENASKVENINEFSALKNAKEKCNAVPDLKYLIVEDDFNAYSNRYDVALATIKAQDLYYINTAEKSWSASVSDKGIRLDNKLKDNDVCDGLAVLENEFDINDIDFAFEFTEIGRIWKGEDPAGSGKHPQAIYVLNVLNEKGKNKNEAQGFSIYFFTNVLNELEVIIYGAATQAGEVQLASGKIGNCGFTNDPYVPYTVRVRINKDTNCYRIWINSLQLTVYFRDILNPEDTIMTHMPEYNVGDEIGEYIFKDDKAYMNFVIFASALTAEERESAITIRMIGDKTFGGYVAPLYMVSLDMESAPTKLTYQKGEVFDKTGLVMKATMSDGSVVNVPMNKIKVLGFASTSKGQKNVSLSYTDESGVTLTKVIKVTIVDAEKEGSSGKKGCGSAIVSVSAFASLVTVAGATLMLKKKR